MDQFSISLILDRLDVSRRKVYERTYPEDGFELGFGRAGHYPGHSHLHFYDVIFAPNGFHLPASAGGKERTGYLLIIPPRTWLDDVSLGDFFFMKFCPSAGQIEIPDKVTERLEEASLREYAEPTAILLDWFEKPSLRRTIFFRLNSDAGTLDVWPEGRSPFIVRR